MKPRKLTLALLSSAVIGAGAFAPAALAASAKVETLPQLPPETVQGAVRYVSGGIGHSEARAFEHARDRYPLSLEFALKAKPRDEFTADVRVSIRNADGKVALLAMSQGPFLLAKLPAGIYDVKATHEGKTLERHVNVVEDKHAQLTFVWPKDHARQNG